MSRALWFAIVALMAKAGWANSTAASFTAGELQYKREPRIAIAHERLKVQPLLVTVEYDFRNDSNDEVVTEMAFPIPDYPCGPYAPPVTFASFTAIADGNPVAYATDARAMVGGQDRTALLAKHGVSIADCAGGEDFPMRVQLSAVARSELASAGLVSKGEVPFPIWSVRVRYHWRQRFPAKSITSVRHTYRPADGDSIYSTSDLGREHLAQELPCVPPDFDAWRRSGSARGEYSGSTVRYILTTARNWAGPIGEFDLDLDGGDTHQVFSCFEGARRLGPGHLHFHARSFAPTSDLSVHFVRTAVGNRAASPSGTVR